MKEGVKLLHIRYSNEHAYASDVLQSPYIKYGFDSSMIALEKEKNKAAYFDTTNSRLKDIIHGLWQIDRPIFRIIGIETQSGCNCTCSFCPVNSKLDPRPYGVLPLPIINKIATELKELNYGHVISLFGNNEPLMDGRIVDIISIFRSSCPDANIKILTNGLLLTYDKVIEMFLAGLSMLVVNNYSDGQRLIKPVQKLIEKAEDLIPYDIRISVRQRNEILTTRAGAAPNKEPVKEPLAQFCALPFVDLQISYTGKVVQCCFDSTNLSDFGNLTSSTLMDIWRNSHFDQLRTNLMNGNRKICALCSACDFDGFRDPFQNPSLPLLREDL